MTMTAKQIGEKLTEIHTALVEKTGEQPFLNITMRVSSENVKIGLYRGYGNGDYEISTAKGDTFEATIEEAFRLIAALPDIETSAKRKFHKNLANVIDEGNSLNMPTGVMAPLGEGMKALSENLLTFDGEIAK